MQSMRIETIGDLALFNRGIPCKKTWQGIENAINIVRQKYDSSIINRAILMKKNNKK